MIILLAGIWLRFHALGRDARFHPDEALFNTFARDAVIKGEWLLPGLLDKPPLMIYANALAMIFVGVSVNDAGVLDFSSVRAGEFAGRLPNTLVSILMIAATGALARQLYGTEPEASGHTLSLLAMFVMASSPFAIAFSASAFTDVFMTFWMVMSLWMVARDRWGAAGLCLALGFASKQPALLYLPLVLAMGLALHGFAFRRLLRFTLPFALGVAALLLWDFARNQPTIWQVSAARKNYPNRLVNLDEIIPRLKIWLGYGQWLLGPGWLTAVLFTSAFVSGFARSRREGRQLATRVDLILLVYLLGFGLTHWLIAFNTFDRYLLPILPLLALLTARGVQFLTRRCAEAAARKASRILTPLRLCAVALAVLNLLSSGKDASEGHINVGGDLGEHDGIDALAAYLNGKPVATVIYDHWLGWELEYYMGAWNDKRRVYYPTPEALVRDALLLPEIGPRYFPVPRDQPVMKWINRLKEAGFAPEAVLIMDHFLVYELTPPQAGKGVSGAG